MFEQTLALFDEYYKTLDQNEDPNISRNPAAEVRERLQQLDYLVGRVRAAEAAHNAAMQRCQSALREHIERVERQGLKWEETPAPISTKLTPEEMAAMQVADLELKIFTEAFYFFAHRVRAIVRHKSKPLPGIEGFEAIGVRNVRNQLLEHPEGNNSRVLIHSFGWGHARGPVLKAVRYGEQEDVFPDQGLYVNADEFKGESGPSAQSSNPSALISC